MLFKREIERCNFAINYKVNMFIDDQKEFIDSNFDFISIITKKQRYNFVVEYKKTTEPNSKIERSHRGLDASSIISHYYKNNRITIDNKNYLLASLSLTLLSKFLRLESCLNK